jgi:hypothetical protein
MDWKKHCYRVGSHVQGWDDLPDLESLVQQARKHIEPWLAAVFQAEHLNVLLGSGFTTAIGFLAGASSTGMSTVGLGTKYDTQISADAERSAKAMGRGSANIEDQLRSALAVLAGLEIIAPVDARPLKEAINAQLLLFLQSLLDTERGIAYVTDDGKRLGMERALQSFLLSFASRAASRERLHIFTTNYDRLIEHGCDLAGLRVIDRFAGALSPVFRSTRVEIDVHYNPPGIRGEPRFMEGVVRLTKLHGSIDWRFDRTQGFIRRSGIPFGAANDHTDVPKDPIDTVMIYPNPAKDVETTEYPYAELFRDYAAAACRPNGVIVTYGYGFGDDHINRVLLDMLTIPSTHLVIIAFSADDRLKGFCAKTRAAQVSLLVGPHFANLQHLVDNYLPKPALDHVTARLTELLKHRTPDDRASSTPAGAGS